jgi:hypothetical protein
MHRRSWLAYPALVLVCAMLAGGCGRPTLPGQQFKDARETAPGAVATDTPLPEEPVREWGPEDAKVEVIAYYPMDERHQRLIDLLREAAEEKYPGKLHVKYVDYRTPEGQAMMRRAELQVSAITINGENSVELDSPAGVRIVDFVRDVGRFWTTDDLEQAIDEAIAEAYGEEAVVSSTE